MSLYDLLIIFHLLLFVYWLGGDMGVFYSSGMVVDTKLSNSARVTAAKIMIDLDFVPRICMTLMLTVGETQAGTLVEWDSLAGALSYDVVRGEVASLADAGSFIDMGTVTCVESQSVDPATLGSEDSSVPSPGQAFFSAAS